MLFNTKKENYLKNFFTGVDSQKTEKARVISLKPLKNNRELRYGNVYKEKKLIGAVILLKKKM